jgi:hypothetical protein
MKASPLLIVVKVTVLVLSALALLAACGCRASTLAGNAGHWT